MKINEVEERVGITKRNIRYYEKEGLLTPGRNSENGYRDYTEADVTELKKIKLLRKLDMPLEEIRRMQHGVLNLEDAVRRHMIVLERERSNLGTMHALCARVLEEGAQLSGLDADRYLAEMERMEQEGTRFVNIKKKDTMSRYLGPLGALMVWAFALDPAEAPPLPVMIAFIAIPAAVIVGVLVALVQRFKQIKGGEEDAASQY